MVAGESVEVDGKMYAVKFMKKHEIIKLKQVDHINGERTLMQLALAEWARRGCRVSSLERLAQSLGFAGWGDRVRLDFRRRVVASGDEVAHPYTVSMIGSFKDDRYVFIVMEARGWCVDASE
jgi:hypothetical protein